MSVTVNVNGVAISYPQTGDSEWGDEATSFAVQTGAALGKLGLSTGASVDIPSTLDVTGATTLDSTLTVAGTTTLNGNTNLGNATSDTIAVTGILNVDSGTLYVNPTDNRVGINDTTPSEALDVTGNALISGTLGVTGNTTITGNVITSIVKASGSGGLTIDSNGGTDVALFGAGGGSGTTLYGGLNGTTATMSGVIFNSDGTVSAPSISFTNDTNTGLYRIGSDKIGIATNGARVGEIGVDYGGFTGNIIQVVSATTTNSTTNSTDTYADISGLTASITPKYNTSKILVLVTTLIGLDSTISSSGRLYAINLLRGATQIAIYDNQTISVNAGGTGGYTFVCAFSYYDSPATTSSTTYKLQIKNNNTQRVTAGLGSSTSSIILLEVQQ
jgi:fibronectin-binding autotransporter adhesin